jgi:hypothetical protein
MVTLKNSTSSDKRTKEAAKQTKESPQNKEDVHSPGSGALAAHGEASSNCNRTAQIIRTKVQRQSPEQLNSRT